MGQIDTFKKWNFFTIDYKYKYNGKELQDELGLNVYDYGARMYDPAAPRFWQIDPLTEDYISQSVYVYAANNPVFFQEKNGESPETMFVDESGKVIADIDDGSDAIYVINEGNEADLIADLIEENVVNDNQDAETNADIGDKHGRTLNDYKNELPYTKDNAKGASFKLGYQRGYEGKKASFKDQFTFQRGTGSAYGAGEGRGRRDKTTGIMSKVQPKIKKGEPKHNFGSMIGNARSARQNAKQAQSNMHTVRSGDTLSGLAKSNNTTVGSLVELNSIKTPDHIEIGQQLKIN